MCLMCVIIRLAALILHCQAPSRQPQTAVTRKTDFCILPVVCVCVFGGGGGDWLFVGLFVGGFCLFPKGRENTFVWHIGYISANKPLETVLGSTTWLRQRPLPCQQCSRKLRTSQDQRAPCFNQYIHHHLMYSP